MITDDLIVVLLYWLGAGTFGSMYYLSKVPKDSEFGKKLARKLSDLTESEKNEALWWSVRCSFVGLGVFSAKIRKRFLEFPI